MPEEETRRILVEAPSGDSFEADVPCGTPLKSVAADFFESQGWPAQDRRGRGQRAVVEQVNPNNPDDTKRLNGELDVCEALEDGDTLRIFPESIAGAVDHKARLRVLIADQNDMTELAERNPAISFEANRTHAADRYEVTLRYRSFVELPPGAQEPRIGDEHRVEIILGSDYPRRAPFVRWITPIFHPNIHDGAVCLGVLQERYLPGLGLTRLVRMLAEMAQWRNFDAFHALENNEEAGEWARDPQNFGQIQAIGGHPLQGPIAGFLKEIDRAVRPRISFRRAGSSA